MKAFVKNGKLNVVVNDINYLFDKSISEDRAVAMIKSGTMNYTEKTYATGTWRFVNDIVLLDEKKFAGIENVVLMEL